MTCRLTRIATIALGSNLPARAGLSPRLAVGAALAALRAVGPVTASHLYRTPAWPPGAGPDFVNACALLRTDLDARALIARLHAIEASFGRARIARWAPRELDIDLLDLGGEVLPSRAIWARWRRLPPAAQAAQAPRRPILPHPRIQDRAFVLVPLCDIAPDWRHPVTGRTARAMRDALPEADLAAIRRL